MKNRRALYEAYREEQRKYLTTGNPARAGDLLNVSAGIPPSKASALLAAIPGRLPSRILSFLRSKARQTSYVLTHSTLLVGPSEHPTTYYAIESLNLARADESTGMVQILTKSGTESALGPMERPAMFANSINRAINGTAAGAPTCNRCIHYRRHQDPLRGNAGSCLYQPIVLGNYDSCQRLTMHQQ